MGRLKPLIIAAIVIVVVVAVLLLMIFVFKDNSADATQTEQTETVTSQETAAEEAPDETVYVISTNYDELTHFELCDPAGDTMYVDVIQPAQEDERITFDVTPGNPYFTYDESLLRSFLYTLTSITAQHVIDGEGQDLAEYGLENPWYIIRTMYADGSEIDLYLGNQTPVDNNWYIMASNSGNIYVIGNYVQSLLSRSEIDFRAITLFPTYEEDDIYENINWVRLTTADGAVIEMQRDFDYSVEYNVGMADYAVSQPTQASGNDTVIKEKVMDAVATVSVYTIEKDLTEDELEEYGFDQPARLEMTDISGNSINILIGNQCVNADYTYIMIDGTMTLLTCPSTAFTWLQVNYVDLMIRTVWYYAIEDVQSVDYLINGQSYRVEMEHYTYINTNDVETDGINATLNGEAFSEVNCRRLYIRTLYFRVVSDLAQVPQGDPDVDITINFLDGSSHNLQLVRVNDRQYAAFVDGEAEFYVYLRNIQTLETAFQTILEGDTIPITLTT